ncbi:MAG: hypothetical protein KKD48_00360 [Nanoarchaeota archaeon]|nr:hypothetical protein [Nanoarchaeota archaeon]
MKTFYRNDCIVYLNERNQEVGFVNDKNEYITKRDARKHQMFLHPKYRHSLAIDTELIDDLIKRRVSLIRIRVINFENKNFWAIIEPLKFKQLGVPIQFDRRKEGINYTGYSNQIRLELNEFIREYDSQIKMTAFLR